jgi:mRNA interferase MazF
MSSLNFDKWNFKKQSLHKVTDAPEFKSREIWWCSVGKNIGFEEDGKNDDFERPVLVIRKYNKQLFLGLPLTSKSKTNKFHYKLPLYNGIESVIILSQARVFSANRLLRRIRFVEPSISDAILTEFMNLTLEKTKSPQKTGKSRTANAGLYSNNIKQKRKSQDLSRAVNGYKK